MQNTVNHNFKYFTTPFILLFFLSNPKKYKITTFALHLGIFSIIVSRRDVRRARRSFSEGGVADQIYGSEIVVKRRGVRVADRARLESVCTARYRGFESLPLRK